MNTEPLTETQLEGRLGRVRAGVRRKIGRRRRMTTIGAGLGLSAVLGGAGMTAAGAFGTARVVVQALAEKDHSDEYAACVARFGIEVSEASPAVRTRLVQEFLEDSSLPKSEWSRYTILNVSYLDDRQPEQAAAASECEALRGYMPD